MLINFDYDGVFADTFDHWFALVRRAHAITGWGRPPTREDFATAESFTFDHIARRCGIAEEQLPRFLQTLYELEDRDRSVPELFPGIVEVVRALADCHTLAIVTANVRASVQRLLDRHRLGGCIARIFDSRDPGSKADKIAAAMDRFGSEPAATFMVGDAISDIRQGKRAGVRTIAAAWGFQDRDLLLTERPDFVAEQPTDLLAILP